MFSSRWLILLLCVSPLLLLAHPIPNLPIKTVFDEAGQVCVRVEVDPRCFAAEPEKVEYMLKPELEALTAEAKDKLKEQAMVILRFEPSGNLQPEWSWSFTQEGNVPLSTAEDRVVLTGEWRQALPAGTIGYAVKALPVGSRTVVFMNQLPGQEMRLTGSVFPAEESPLLDLHYYQTSWWQVFANMMRQGFLHVLPLGLDHILFVLGLFLLSREWKPLLMQVTVFTVAHTLTLGLTTLGWVSVPGEIVEPIIAGSIAVVALENIFHQRYTSWRLLVVFIFGLIHGMGFAGALADLNLPVASLVVGLVGFNVGVEGGQIAVILLALVLTFWIKDQAVYRKRIVVPVSIMISCMGLYWMVERLMGA
jgi:hypothetical protein